MKIVHWKFWAKLPETEKLLFTTILKETTPNQLIWNLEKLCGIFNKKYSDNHVVMDFSPLHLPADVSIKSALYRVLRNLAVASKEHYIHKGDRSVGGLVVQQQLCGPINAPVADNAIMALSHFSKEGQVASIGEQPLKLMLDPKAKQE